MKVSIIGGTGYVGLVTGIGLAACGNHVVCADIDRQKINNMNKGILPIYEEGLDELLKLAGRKGKITFTSCIKTAVAESDILIVAVGTPENKYGEADMSQMMKALKTIADCMDRYKVIAIKSTVPVGTCEMARSFIRGNLRNSSVPFDIVSNPEFLREGSAVKDFMHPDRIVIGTDSRKASEMMKELYGSFDCPIVVTDARSTEMIKYACNSYLATRLSFINEIAEICERVDADIRSVIDGMKYDKRIGGHYLSPGPGFGGPCLSKDIKSLMSFGNRSGANVSVLKAVLKRNEIQIANIIHSIRAELENLRNRKIAVLGLSFKAGTDDTRNSPALHLIEALAGSKADIHIYDPVVKEIPGPLNFSVVLAESIEDAAYKADCMVIMTEWEEFKNIDLKKLYLLMSNPFIVDTRNLLSLTKVRELGFVYKGIGIRNRNYSELADTLKNIV